MLDFPKRVKSHAHLRDQIDESVRTKRPGEEDLDKARTALGSLSQVTFLVEKVAAMIEIEREAARAEPLGKPTEIEDAYQWIRENPAKSGRDHACAQCMEGYADAPLVIEGFVCVPHRAEVPCA